MDQRINIDVNQAFLNNDGVIARTVALLVLTSQAYEEQGMREEADAIDVAVGILAGVHEIVTGLPYETFEERVLAQAEALGYETATFSVKH